MKPRLHTKTSEDGKRLKILGKTILAEAPSRSNRPYELGKHRLREIEKVIRSRHGVFVPDPCDTEDRGFCLAYVRCAAKAGTKQNMKDWCARWAPWVTVLELEEISSQAGKVSGMLPADVVAKMLHVTYSERSRLSLKTIGACDVSRHHRDKLAKERKRERDRKRQEAKRRAEGRVDRKSQQAQTKTAIKPWKEMGVSRATYYRRLRETKVSPTPPLHRE